MSLLLVVIATALAILGIAAGIWVRRVLSAWLTFQNHFVVACPSDQKASGVAIDGAHAAWTAGLGKTDLRLSGCSQWPERAGCDQRCREQIQRAPEECLPRTMLAQWREGRCCVECGQPVGEAYWTARKPVLLTSDSKLQTWDEIPLDELKLVLDTAKPVCFDCYVTAKIGPISAVSLL